MALEKSTEFTKRTFDLEPLRHLSADRKIENEYWHLKKFMVELNGL